MITPLLNTMMIAVQKTANYVNRDFNEITFLLKNPHKAISFAQESHKKVCKILYEDLHKIKSSYSFILPDSTKDIKKDLSNFFVINGIVGLNNFSAGIPYFCISLALERDSKIFAAIIFNPITNEMFFAEQGVGAFYNKQKLYYNPIEKHLHSINAILATDVQAIKESPSNLKALILNCPALEICYLANNKFIACAYSSPIKLQEIAPALLIAQEAHLTLNYAVKDDNIIGLNSKESL